MTPKYCQNCGTKAESAVSKFCASCGTPLNGLASTSVAQVRKMPAKFSRPIQSGENDDDEGTDISEVPQLSNLELEIDDDGPVEFAGYSSASTFVINPDGSQSIRKFKPRKI